MAGVGLVLGMAISLTGCDGSQTFERPVASTAATFPATWDDDLLVGTSTTPSKPGFEAEEVGVARYADDGKGIYYVIGWLVEPELDSRKYDIVHVSEIAGTPEIVPAETEAGIPIDVLADQRIDVDAWTRDIGPSPKGTLSARIGKKNDAHTATVVITGSSQDEKTLTVWDSGTCYCAKWFDDRTLLVAVEGKRRKGALLRVDVTSGRTDVIRELSSQSVDRIVVDPEGFALFDVNDYSSTTSFVGELYRYDGASGAVRPLGPVSMMGWWDYSPKYNRLIERSEDEPVVLERRLPEQ
jgi:hypothetical protein